MDRRQFLSTPAWALAPAAPGAPRSGCQCHLFCPDLRRLLEKRHDPPRVYRMGGDDFVVIGQRTRRILHSRVDPKLIANNVRSLKFSAEEESKIFPGNARRQFRL